MRQVQEFYDDRWYERKVKTNRGEESEENRNAVRRKRP